LEPTLLDGGAVFVPVFVCGAVMKRCRIQEEVDFGARLISLLSFISEVHCVEFG
jgi:hypothetical protein